MGITRGSDLEKISINEIPVTDKHFVGDAIWESICYTRAQNESVRIVSNGPDTNLVLFSRLIAEKSIVLSDCYAHRWQKDVANPVHTAYWRGLVDQMILCRKGLLSQNIVISPAVLKRSVGDMEDLDYEVDFTDSLESPLSTFLGVGSQVMNFKNGLSSQKKPLVVPLMEIQVPAIRGVDPWVLSEMFEGEGISFKKLRYALSNFRTTSEDSLSSSKLREMAEHIDYEVASLEEQFQTLLRKRETLLSKAGMGLVGVALAVSLPPTLSSVAAALGAAAMGVNALDYVAAVRESKANLKAHDYYLAWKAFKSSRE